MSDTYLSPSAHLWFQLHLKQFCISPDSTSGVLFPGPFPWLGELNKSTLDKGERGLAASCPGATLKQRRNGTGEKMFQPLFLSDGYLGYLWRHYAQVSEMLVELRSSWYTGGRPLWHIFIIALSSALTHSPFLHACLLRSPSKLQPVPRSLFQTLLWKEPKMRWVLRLFVCLFVCFN